MKISETERFNILIEEFKKRDNRTIDTSDKILQEKFGDVSSKTVQRTIEKFMLKYNSVIEVKGKRKKTYKLAIPMDIISESFEHFEDIAWLLSMIHDSDPIIFKELEHYIKKDQNIYLFKNTPFEDLTTLESKESFKRLKKIIQARDYAKIKFLNDEQIYDNVKCLKLVFMDNNWYISYIDETDTLLFGRINFIQSVDFATKEGHFQLSTVTKQMKFLNTVQNSMSLYGQKKKVATLKATPFIAKYFDKDMKLFLSTQKFQKKLEDGSIIFTIEYTQELEIFPFIQKWLPNLIIIEPQELKDIYLKKLEESVKNHR